MKKANTALALILAVLVGTGLYFLFGTHLKADVSAARSGDVLTLNLALKNGSLFPYESIEFIASPDPAVLTGTQGAGEDVPILSEKDVQATLNLPEGQSSTLQIGYYVLGTRRTITLSID